MIVISFFSWDRRRRRQVRDTRKRDGDRRRSSLVFRIRSHSHRIDGGVDWWKDHPCRRSTCCGNVLYARGIGRYLLERLIGLARGKTNRSSSNCRSFTRSQISLLLSSLPHVKTINLSLNPFPSDYQILPNELHWPNLNTLCLNGSLITLEMIMELLKKTPKSVVRLSLIDRNVFSSVWKNCKSVRITIERLGRITISLTRIFIGCTSRTTIWPIGNRSADWDDCFRICKRWSPAPIRWPVFDPRTTM